MARAFHSAQCVSQPQQLQGHLAIHLCMESLSSPSEQKGLGTQLLLLDRRRDLHVYKTAASTSTSADRRKSSTTSPETSEGLQWPQPRLREDIGPRLRPLTNSRPAVRFHCFCQKSFKVLAHNEVADPRARQRYRIGSELFHHKLPSRRQKI